MLKKGEPVIKCHPIKIDGKDSVIFTPNTTAMFLNLSNKCYKKALTFNFKKILLDKNISEEVYFDSLEYYMASIIFAYTALETFSNSLIPEGYKFTQLRDDKKCTEKYNKDQIERYIKLDTKLGLILPEILNINSIKGTTLWEDYLELKNIRDRIIHIKSIDIEYNKTNDFFNHLWNDLVNNGNLKNYTGNTKKIIEYYLEDKKPSWFEKCPF